jgi:biopolymer transport protein ExbD
MRFRPKGADDEMRVELTSMTDIIFLLLIFFMISTTFEGTRKSLDIQLPESKAAEVAQEVRQRIIEMSVDDALRLDGQPVPLQDLAQRLVHDTAQAHRQAVIIRADRRLPYGKVITVLDLVRQANIRDIAVAVR